MKRESLDDIRESLNLPRDVDIFSVSEVTDCVARALLNVPDLSQAYVLGEVTDLHSAPSGHTYFSLKDGKSRIECILRKEKKIGFELEHGMQILLLASIMVYEPRGNYQLRVENVFPVGEGMLHMKYKQLKEKLRKEGLFDEKYKKPLPHIPSCIGIISSRTARGYSDVISVLDSRFPGMNIKFYSSPMQGDKAPKNIIRGIQKLNKFKEIDVILIVRGGGSPEDLMCFNDEALAREIFKSKTPIVSAIGHDADTTICDMVADDSAATPSMGAKIICPDRSELLSALNGIKEELNRVYSNYLNLKKKEAEVRKSHEKAIVMKKELEKVSHYRQDMLKREYEIKMYKILLIMFIIIIIIGIIWWLL